MTKLIKKFIPFPYWHTDFFESWLSDMSKEGLCLVTASNMCCKFKKDKPKNNSYRIEIAEKDNQLPSYTIQKYEDNHWNFITNAGRFYIFCSENEYASTEIYHENEEYIKMLSNYIKRIYLGAVLIILLSAFAIFTILRTADMTSTHFNPILGLVSITSVDLFTIIPMIISVISMLYDSLFAIRLNRKLKNDYTINHHRPWKCHKYFYLLRHVCYYMIIIFLLINSILYAHNNSSRYLLDEELKELPFITSAELTYPTNYDNYIQSKNALLSNFYFANLSTKANYYTNKNNININRINTSYYKIKLKSLTENVTEILLKEKLNNSYTKLSDDPYFKNIYVNECNTGFRMILSTDNEIWYMDCYGDVDKEYIIEILRNKVSHIS